MKKLKRLNYLLPIIIILTVIYIWIIIRNNGVIVFYGDSYKQQIQFYAGMWEKIHSGSIGFWDWSMVFGTNSFAQTFYCQLNNPYLYLVLLFPKAMIPQVYTFTNILKIFLTYLAAYWWLRKLDRSFQAAIIGALIVSFSGWFLTVYEWGHLLDVFPLYFLSLIFVEDHFRDQRIYPLVITLAVMMIINYYCAYMFLPFLLVYGLGSLYVHQSNIKLKDYLRFFIRCVGYILLAVCIAGVVLLPSAYIVMMNSRISESYGAIINISAFYRFFSSAFLPLSYRSMSNVLTYYNAMGSYGGISLFSLFITPFSLVILLFIPGKKAKKAIMMLYGLFFLAMLFPLAYKLLQGTEETRWFYMFSIISAMAVSLVFDQVMAWRNNTRTILLAFIILLAVMGLMVFISVSGQLYGDSNLLKKYLLAFSFFNLVYLLCYLKKWRYVMIGLVMLEAMLCFRQNINLNLLVDESLIDTTEYQGVMDYVKSMDDGFYRINLSQTLLKNLNSDSEYNFVMANLPYGYDIMGTSGYSSLYDFQQDEYLDRYKDSWTFYQATGRLYSSLLENVKYWIGTKDDIAPFGFSLITTYGDYMIYQNNYFIELGYYTDRIASEDLVSNFYYFEQDQIMFGYAVTAAGTDDFALDPNVILAGNWVEPDYFELPLSNAENGTQIIVENFDMSYLSITFMKDGEVVYEKNFYQNNYVSVYCPADIDFDMVIVQIDSDYIAGSMMNVYYLQDFSYFDEIYTLDQQTALTNVIQTGTDMIAADISIPESMDNGILVTSIPYDSGWQVYVDGEKTAISEVDMGFIGLTLSTGDHHIVFQYESPYFREGAILSAGGVLMLLIIEYKRHKAK